MSIRLRLLLLVFAVWLPAAIAFGVLARATYEREAEGARSTIQQMGEQLKSLVERELHKRAVLAQTLAAALEVGNNDLRRFHKEATAATRESGDWVVLLDRTLLLSNTLVPFDEVRALARSWTQHVTGAPEVVFNREGPILKRPILVVLAAAPGVSSPRYNVGVGFEPNAMQAIVEQVSYPEGGVAAVLDRNQFLIARSRDPQKWVGRQGTGDIQRRIKSGQSGFAESKTLDGVPSLTYLSQVDRFGWNVAIALPQAALAAAARKATVRFVTASGLLLLIGLGVAFYAARRISGPVLALREAAVELGNDAVPPKLSTGVREADDVSAALFEAGVRARQAGATLERRVAEAVQKAEQAQATLLEARKHEAIGRLTGGIAHDFNNLLQTISTALQLLDRTTEESPQRRVLEAAMRASNKAAGLIRQMLNFGRAQSLRPQLVDLRDFLLKNQDLASKAVGGRVELKASVESDLPPLLVDPTQLELATLNLVFNASQAMPDGGNILIVGRHAHPEETSSLGSGRYLCLQVSDDGPGMTPEVLGRAFEPYFTTKPVGEGSGLGLSQVLSFAQQSGGDVRLQSTPGIGTRVCLFLPAAAAVVDPAQEPGRARGATLAQRPLRVLMVEDDLLVSSVVVPALQAAGHEVVLCTTADAAAPLLRDETRFDILFTDVVTPGKMNGFDLIHWCRTHRPSLPSVVASGYTAQQSDHGAAVLPKPYNVDDLLEALQRAMDPETEPG